jgi:hypothetical protein
VRVDVPLKDQLNNSTPRGGKIPEIEVFGQIGDGTTRAWPTGGGARKMAARPAAAGLAIRHGLQGKVEKSCI